MSVYCLIYLQNIAHLTSLSVLSLQSNRVTVIENLDGLANLAELYISHNGLEAISGLENLVCELHRAYRGF